MADKIEGSPEQLRYIHRAMLDSIIATEQRRQATYTSFITLLTAGVAAFVYVATEKESPQLVGWIVFYLAILSTIWLLTAYYYRLLAVAKWEVMMKIESHFPYRPFEEEWSILEKRKCKIRGKEIFGLIQFEILYPGLILSLSILYGLYALFYPTAKIFG